MRPRPRTTPDPSVTSTAHQEAIAAGDEHYKLWQRNVIDKYKEMSEEDIKLDLQATAFPFAVLCENLIGDFNIGTIFRNSNCFNAKEIFYIGDKKFDKRACQGSYNYNTIQWLSTIDEVLSLKERYTFIGADNIPGAVPLYTYEWQPNSLIVFGSEGVGITPTMQSLCKDIIYIPQFGSIRSLNVGTASGIFMNDFVTKFMNKK
jgi:tRNA G18 (ribose-2'-O)-methylase SpoU